MRVGRYLVQGVDVWLNNPRRPLEASGTSGMKAAMNGVVNCSVLDGWWDEGWNGHQRLGHRRSRDQPRRGRPGLARRPGPVPDPGAGDRAPLVRPRPARPAPPVAGHDARVDQEHASGGSRPARMLEEYVEQLVPAGRAAAPRRRRRRGGVLTALIDPTTRMPRAPGLRPGGCARHPRPLLPAAARGPVHGPDAAGPDRLPCPRLERSRSRPSPTPRTRRRATSGASAGTWDRRWPAGCDASSRSSTTRSWARTTATTAWPRPITTRSCPTPPRATGAPRSAGGCATSSCGWAVGPRGLWLPETAIDRLTLRTMVEEGIRWTILAPWQAAGAVDTGIAYCRGGGREPAAHRRLLRCRAVGRGQLRSVRDHRRRPLPGHARPPPSGRG